MPVIDVTLVLARGALAPTGAAQQLANVLGFALKAPPGHVWVRLKELDAAHYAENESTVDDSELPVFVTVLCAHLPVAVDLQIEVDALVSAVASCLVRSRERVHVEYAPAGAGRVAFGGKLAR